ncbi:Dpc25p KNAG_0A01710 [Huiozyma naganishii CBS 8797]|uniref:Oxidoreductase-like domain-containing protein n=1 Tax=Huiozyma naganishii (strain ATCC MYA-139 / BCRC 22969 / CBS 8797 / KCTC 17520 / NBRC 10181 / NCYC 3082 / Yp74L-3) TaxID=1071383 RepID=J7QZG3_HUIN7|nr:hypothetical protein KNAG_0A01710 [Kazachstania naganishii CBS 8797]CCK67860.1 hypothetical protein KNAG_0A01710 [Kazachstania naganishii CBS 8797]
MMMMKVLTVGGPRCISTTASVHMTFEGRLKAGTLTPEQTLAKVFGGRVRGDPPRATSRMEGLGERVIAGVSVPGRPREPDNCCMSGCTHCVWEIFSDDVKYWRSRRREAAKRISSTQDTWPRDWDPPLPLLEAKNVPQELQHEKALLDSKRQDVPKPQLFPPRETDLPASVLAAKRRNALARAQEKKQQADTAGPDDNEDDTDPWEDVPVHIRAFAEFERKKRLQRRQQRAARK